MANNRMYLICSACNERFKLAKYYPSTGWYTNLVQDSPEKREEEAVGWFVDFQQWLERHSHDYDNKGEKNIRFAYESDPVFSEGKWTEYFAGKAVE